MSQYARSKREQFESFLNKDSTMAMDTTTMTNTNTSSLVMLNMRVTANSSQGHRKYMEDCYKIRFQRETTNNTTTLGGKLLNNNKIESANHIDTNNNTQQSDILFSYFAIFDGHGGKEAAQFCKEKLYWKIIESDDFWSNDDARILKAIRDGFVKCHMDMWNELPKWPKTGSGLPSTSGTTATVLFIKKSKAYVGHVGDSGIAVGFTKSSTDTVTGLSTPWQGRKLTRDHKPEDPIELRRIQNSGGSVMAKSGVNRVVWNRPIFNSSTAPAATTNVSSHFKSQPNLVSSNSTPYELNYLRSQPNVQTERVPFLAVARSLGDLWSYDLARDEFIVSPVPDVFTFELDPRVHKCLILATDGLWNILRATECAELVRHTDRETEMLSAKVTNKQANSNKSAQPFVNPSQRLVNTAIQRCCEKTIRADNTSCVTIMLDLPADYQKSAANETTLLNKTNFERLIQNKTFDNFSRRCNESDEFDDFYDELEEEDEDEELSSGKSENESEFKSARMMKTFSGQMLTSSTVVESEPELNTPISNDKRSRSLISLRRRHWSASSNRSSSVFASAANPAVALPPRNSRFVNTDARNAPQCVPSSQSMSNQWQKQQRQSTFINNNSRNQSSSKVKTNSLRNSSNLINSRRSGNLNSSVSALLGVSKLSRNLRKSFNDLYTITANKLGHTSSSTISPAFSSSSSIKNGGSDNDFDDLKENKLERKKAKSTLDINSVQQNYVADRAQRPVVEQTAGSNHSSGFKRFKNTLIKTKNTLFCRKRNDQSSLKNTLVVSKTSSNIASAVSQKNEQTNTNDVTINKTLKNLKRKSCSSPSLDRLGGYNLTTASKFDLELDANQSFVNNFRSRFLKRNRSSKLNEQHLNSTTITAKLSTTNLSNNIKRPKFY